MGIFKNQKVKHITFGFASAVLIWIIILLVIVNNISRNISIIIIILEFDKNNFDY